MEENTLTNRLTNIPMSIKIMQQLENCSYITAQRKLKRQRKKFAENIVSSSYTVWDYCIMTGRDENYINLKLKL